jgi:hypothetical protein
MIVRNFSSVIQIKIIFKILITLSKSKLNQNRVIVERLRHQIKTKRKASQNKQGIPTKIEEAGTLNKYRC